MRRRLYRSGHKSRLPNYGAAPVYDPLWHVGWVIRDPGVSGVRTCRHGVRAATWEEAIAKSEAILGAAAPGEVRQCSCYVPTTLAELARPV